MCLHSVNEIDGASFLDLTDSDVKSMVTKLGIVKKIRRLQLLVSSLLLLVYKLAKFRIPFPHAAALDVVLFGHESPSQFTYVDHQN